MIRFEVFKRDSFTCQYCGGKAPDVILECDHISPVAGGGDNDILNLLTSCQACNAGKGARPLSEQTTLAKQRAQLEELNERRQQLEAMLEWRRGLARLDDDKVDAFEQALHAHTGRNLTDKGRITMRRLITEYGLSDALSVLDELWGQYGAVDKDGISTQESTDKVWGLIPKLLKFRRSSSAKPYLRDLLYIRGILRNRLSGVDEHEAIRILEDAHLAGDSIEDLKEFAKEVTSWRRFRDQLIATTEWEKQRMASK